MAYSKELRHDNEVTWHNLDMKFCSLVTSFHLRH